MITGKKTNLTCATSILSSMFLINFSLLSWLLYRQKWLGSFITNYAELAIFSLPPCSSCSAPMDAHAALQWQQETLLLLKDFKYRTRCTQSHNLDCFVLDLTIKYQVTKKARDFKSIEAYISRLKQKALKTTRVPKFWP